MRPAAPGPAAQASAALVGLGLLLSACTTAEAPRPPAQEALRVPPPVPREQPASNYKIGKPYQIEGTWYYPRVDYNYQETGIGSWYGPGFHGRTTANGETYDQEDLTAAHRTLPMPSMVRVTNLDNGRSLKLRVNDRGPYARGRIIDVSRKAAELLGFERQGTAKVKVEILESESQLLAVALSGSDDAAGLPKAAPTVAVSVAPLGGPLGGPAAANGHAGSGRALAKDNLPKPDGRVTTVPVHSRNLYVQAGSFMYFHNAQRLQVRLSRWGRFVVAPTIIDGRHFFRVRAGPITDVGEADRIMTMLLSQGHTETQIVVE